MINTVTLHLARFVLGSWVNVSRWQTILVCNQPPSQLSLAIPLSVSTVITSHLRGLAV